MNPVVAGIGVTDAAASGVGAAAVLGGRALATGTPTDGIGSGRWIPAWVPGWVVSLVATAIVVVAAWAIARLAMRLLGRRVAQHFDRPSLTRTVLRGVRVGIYLVAGLVVLRINGLDLGNIALSVTVFSAVVGVILAPIVGSVISGVFLLADQPYEIGDMIELTDEDKRGFVEDITLRYTKIFTLDNTFLVVPNGKIRDRDVYNYSAEDPRTRQTLDVLVTYESDIQQARELIERSARRVDSVIQGGPRIRIGASRYPAAPDCLIGSFADHGVLLRLRYWVEEPYRLQTVRSLVQTNIWEALEDADVEIAYPHSHLYFDDTSGELQVSMADRWDTEYRARRATEAERTAKGVESEETVGEAATGETATGEAASEQTATGETPSEETTDGETATEDDS